MVYSIENSIYLEVKDLEKYGLNNGRIKAAINHAKQQRDSGKINNNWLTIPNPSHGGKILIKFSSISPAISVKYNLPTEDELKQNLSVESVVSIASKNEILVNSAQQALKDCISKSYLEHYPSYLKQFSGNKSKALKYSRNHAVFCYLVELYTSEQFEALKQAFEVYVKLGLPSTCSNYIAFKRKLSKMESLGVENCIINKLNGKESNRKKTTNLHIAIVEKLYADPHKYKQNHIYKVLVDFCKSESAFIPSRSWVKQYLAQSEVQNRLCEFRYGLKQYNDTVGAYMPREKALYAGDLWQMDGTPLQFQCIDESGKLIRLNLYVVLDAHSNKIVGFDLSLSEDKHTVINSLQRAFNLHGHLPFEILHDNFSATKTDEFKALSEKLNSVGVNFRAAKVGNPADKANVERFFETFQSKYCTLIDGYLGEGITSKRKDARANPDFIKKVYDKGLPNINEMKVRVIELINMYNVCKNDETESCSKIYAESKKPNIKEVDKVQLSVLFWKEKEIKVSRSMVKMTVQKHDFTFEIYDNDLKNKLNGTTVKCRYDEADMSAVYLFDLENNTLLCECKANYKPHQAQANQTETDKESILAYDAKKKSHRLHNHKKTQEILKAGAEETENKELNTVSPYSLFKNEANESEFNELNQLLAMQSGIDFKQVSEYKPIESEISFLNASKNSINNALNKKVFETTPSLKPYNRDEETE